MDKVTTGKPPIKVMEPGNELFLMVFQDFLAEEGRV